MRSKPLTKRLLSAALAFVLALSLLPAAVFAATGTNTYTKVAAVSELLVGDKVIFVSDTTDFAMSSQNSNNRAQAAITRVGDTITLDKVSGSGFVQEFTVEAGNKTGTFAFKTSEGYLFASGTNKEYYLRTEGTMSDNSSWAVTISAGATSLTAQGTNTNKVMQYNTSGIFSCYGTASQKPLSIYRRTG